jgi:hypothetical protein
LHKFPCGLRNTRNFSNWWRKFHYDVQLRRKGFCVCRWSGGSPQDWKSIKIVSNANLTSSQPSRQRRRSIQEAIFLSSPLIWD